MELFECAEHYVIVSGASALWCSRATGSIRVRPASSLDTAWNPVCLGLVRGVIGKIQCWPGLPQQLAVIKACTRVGNTMPVFSGTEAQNVHAEPDSKPEGLCVNVNRITKIGFIALATDIACTEQFDLCPKHHFGIRKPEKIVQPTVYQADNENALVNVGRELRGQFSKVITQITHLPIGVEKQTSQPGAKLSESSSSTQLTALANSKQQPVAMSNQPSPGISSKSANPELIARASRLERRIHDELGRLFGEGHFYFAEHARLHPYLHRLFSFTVPDADRQDGTAAASINDYVFNYALLGEIFEAYRAALRPRTAPETVDVLDAELERLTPQELETLFEPFLLVVICGHVGFVDLPLGRPGGMFDAGGRLWLFSRRLRRRNGVRYRRRGADPQSGACANCVETTQLFEFSYELQPDAEHTDRPRSARTEYLAFRQLRGSVPICWSQSNTVKYNPPIRVDTNAALNAQAFRAHFEWLLGHYTPHRLVYISLIDQNAEELSNTSNRTHLPTASVPAGRNELLPVRPEAVMASPAESDAGAPTNRSDMEQQAGEAQLADCFLRHATALDDPRLCFVAFNFHEFCRNGHYEHLALLTDELAPLVREIGFDWYRHGQYASQQDGVCRINCVDCLDRTNVVQAVLARFVLETQLRKVSALRPDEPLSGDCLVRFQQLWADNGDALSQQYAGTASLKGDFTRTGERKLRGILQDGYYSAARYAQRFRDVLRQLAWSAACGELRQAPEFTAALERDSLGTTAALGSPTASPRKRASLTHASALTAGLLTFRLDVLLPIALLSHNASANDPLAASDAPGPTADRRVNDEQVRLEAANNDVVQTRVRVTGAMVPPPLLRTLLTMRPSSSELPLGARLSVLFAKRDSMLLHVVERVKHALLASGELCFGAFPLVDMDAKRSTSHDVVLAHTFDVLLFVARRSLYVVRDASEANFYGLPYCECIPVSALERVELHVAQLPLRQCNTPVSSNSEADAETDVGPDTPLVSDASVSVGYVRLHLSLTGGTSQPSALSLQRSLFHTFMHPRRRLFNHVLLAVSNEDEMREALKNCADTLQIVADMGACDPEKRLACSFIDSFNRRKVGRTKSRTFACADASWLFDFSSLSHSKLDVPSLDSDLGTRDTAVSDKQIANKSPTLPTADLPSSNDAAEPPQGALQPELDDGSDEDKSDAEISDELATFDAELLDERKKDAESLSDAEADGDRDSVQMRTRQHARPNSLLRSNRLSFSCEDLRTNPQTNALARSASTSLRCNAATLPTELLSDTAERSQPAEVCHGVYAEADDDKSRQTEKTGIEQDDSKKLTNWFTRFREKVTPGNAPVEQQRDAAHFSAASEAERHSVSPKHASAENAFSFGKLKLKFGVPNPLGKKLFAPNVNASLMLNTDTSAVGVANSKQNDAKEAHKHVVNVNGEKADSESERGQRNNPDRSAALLPNLALFAASNFQNALTNVAKDVQSAVQVQLNASTQQPLLVDKVRAVMKRNAEENARRFSGQTRTKLLVFNKI